VAGTKRLALSKTALKDPRPVLIVDDDAAHRLMLRETLKDRGYIPVEAASGEEGLKILKSQVADLVLLDIKMPGMGGMEALRKIKAFNPALPVIMMTAAIQAVIHPSRGKEEEAYAGLQGLDDMDLVAESSVMRDVLDDAMRVASTDATVLLTGESGSGKEIIAEVIHRKGPRAEKMMMRVNCAAIPDTLIESELFGHKKGSFTGADRDKEGRFQAAEGGTLFLDEIGDLPLTAQAKLLRVLQDGKVTPVGDTNEIETDVRIIVATNKNLEDEVAKEGFREDLFYRISVFPIRVPPLRERKIDIPPLADMFLKKFADRHGKDIRGFTPRALTGLLSHDWPGNVRELMNAIERAVILSRYEYMDVGDFPGLHIGEAEGLGETAERLETGITLREMEKILIEKTLSDTDSNRTHAARILGITRKTLLAKIRDYGIEG
jgi:two-component system response regulator HydG